MTTILRPSPSGKVLFCVNFTFAVIPIIISIIITIIGHHHSTKNVVSLFFQGAYSHSLAEWALTACSWFAKDLPRIKRQQKDRNWEPYYVEELRSAYLTQPWAASVYRGSRHDSYRRRLFFSF